MTSCPSAITGVKRRDGSTAPFDAGKIKAAIRKAVVALEPLAKKSPDDIAEEFSRRAVALLSSGNGRMLTVEEIQKAILQVLHEDAGKGRDTLMRDPLRLWECYLFYSRGRDLVRAGALPDELFIPKTISERAVRRTLEWNRRWNCGSIEQLNRWFRGDNERDVRELIIAAEEERLRSIKEAAVQINQAIKERDIRLIVICGPSSSGKTTTIRASLDFLSRYVKGLRFQGIEVDNYFRDWNEYHRYEYDVDGRKEIDYDYERPEAYRVDLLNEHLSELLAGKETLLPEYDFRARKPLPHTKRFRLEEGAILLLDCFHGIHPMITAAVPREKKLILYTEAMNMIEDGEGEYARWTDIRLMRRALRDAVQRGMPTIANFWHWWLVRQGEAEMLPFIGTADIVLNGGHPCELPVYKRRLYDLLTGEIIPVLERNPDLFDGFARARRIAKLLGEVETAAEQQIALVPATSVMREFIGGSIWFENERSREKETEPDENEERACGI